MKTPKELQPLLDDGIIDGVLRRLKSGKEATVYLVDCGGRVRCAKVYKDSQQRGFHKLAEYQEGRTVRGSRDTRALGKGGKHGRSVQEAQWKNAEVEALYRLSRAGVRVPEPYGVFDGVLLMELVCDAAGDPAPRLNDVALEPDQALAWHAFMIRQVVLILCAGLIHGDLAFAGGGEFRPDAGDRLFVGQPPLVHQLRHQERRDSLGDREDRAQGIGVKKPGLGSIGMASPQVDDDLAVLGEAEPGPQLSVLGEIRREGLGQGLEPWRGKAPYLSLGHACKLAKAVLARKAGDQICSGLFGLRRESWSP